MGEPKPTIEDSLGETVPASSPTGSGRPRTSRMSDGLAGTQLDHFTVERRLGQGGMGAVWVALDRSLDRHVALKVLNDDLLDDAAQEERFLREARAQARLNHPNVVHIYHIGRRPKPDGASGGSLYFAMELVDGPSLEQIVEKEEKLDPERARTAMIEVARGLREAHRAGFIHRDIKPSNLLRDKNGYVKIADFGLVKPVHGDVKITQEGAMVGSPLYMAPEQARGAEVDFRADMYSLGASFYQLLGGEPPFDGPSALAVIAKHLTEPLVPLRERAPDVPPPLARIVDRLLAKSADDRYASYDALIADLEAAAPTAVQYAGFFTRAGAVLLDSLVATACVWVLGPVLGIALHLAHVTVGHALFGQTLAKYFLRIRVQRIDGTKLGPTRSLLRTFSALWFPFYVALVVVALQGVQGLLGVADNLDPTQLDTLRQFGVGIVLGNVVPALFWFAGLTLAAFHPHKRALHDLLVGTVVVYRLGGGTPARAVLESPSRGD